jgi:hypothetical protein
MIRGEWLPLTLEPADREQALVTSGRLSLIPPGNSCPVSPEINLPDGVTFSVNDKTQDVDDPALSCAWGSPPSPQGYRTAWYRFTAPYYGTVLIHTLNSNYDTVVEIYGGSCGSLARVACNDDHQGFTSQLSFSVVQGETYFIEVADWQKDPPSGTATLTLTALINPVASNWKPAGVMPLARSRHATVVVGKYIYVIGGQSGSLGAPVVERRLERYDTNPPPNTSPWLSLADSPGASGYSNSTAAYVDGPNDSGRIYIPSGYTGNNSSYGGDHLAYDIAADSWITATSAPWPGGTPIAWSAAVANPAENGYYLTGGLSSLPPFDPGAQVHDEVFFYSASTGSWSSVTSMATARYGHAAALVGGRICVVGGITASNVLLPNGECHTPGSGTWTVTGNLNFPRYAAGSAVGPGGKWYLFGGVDAAGEAVPVTEVYDPATNSWAVLDVADDLGGDRLDNGDSWPARAWPRGGFVGSTLWSIGGNNMPDSLALPQVDRLFVPSYEVLLPLTARNFNQDDAHDGTLAMARKLTMNQPMQQDFDELLDLVDVYRFDLTSQKRITATLSHIPAGSDYAFSLYNANKFLWTSSDNPGNLNESKSLILSAGTYYILVERVNGLPQPGQNYQILVKE